MTDKHDTIRQDSVKQVPGSASYIKRFLLEAVCSKIETWNVNQQEAAKLAGTDRVTLCNMLNGNRIPSLATLIKMATAIGLTVEIIVKEPADAAPPVEPHLATRLQPIRRRYSRPRRTRVAADEA